MSKLLRVECPECGTVRYCDEDGLCHCGLELCWVYENRREYMGESIRRIDWWRVLHGQDRWSKEYEAEKAGLA